MQALDCPLFFTTKIKQSSPIKASLMKGEKGDGLAPTLLLLLLRFGLIKDENPPPPDLIETRSH